MTSTILNDSYIFLQSIFWGYGFFVLILFILFFLVGRDEVKHEILNWLSTINLCFVLAMIADLINLIVSYALPKGEPVVAANKYFTAAGRIFLLVEFALAVLFLFPHFRRRWTYSFATIMIISWFKICYLFTGNYGAWLSFRDHMPGRSWYPVIFFATLFSCYVALFLLELLPYSSYLLKRKRRAPHV